MASIKRWFLSLLLPLLFVPTATAQQFGVWTIIDSGIVNNAVVRNVYAIACPDPEFCICTAQEIVPDTFGVVEVQVIRRTTDGGRTWTRVVVDSSRLSIGYESPLWRCVAAPTRNLIVAADDSGSIYRSIDQGNTWVRTHIRTDETQVYRLRMRDSANGLYWFWPTLWRTTDGGEHWNIVKMFETLPDTLRNRGVSDVALLSDGTILVYVGSYKRSYNVCRSDDNGEHWQVLSSDQNPGERMYFYNDRQGWIVGSERTGIGDTQKDLIYHTSDGGRTWEIQVMKMIYPPWGLYDVAFTDTLNGIAVGGTGKILQTTDGGKQWVQQPVIVDTNHPNALEVLAYPVGYRAYASSSSHGYIFRYDHDSTANTPEISTVTEPASKMRVDIVSNQMIIQLLIHSHGFAQLSLCNVLGNIIRIGAPYRSPGRYKEIIDLNAFSPGIYFVQLITGKTTTTVPVVFTR